ncbi:ABC transporter substrate-binding protein [Clostridium sp. MB05]|uniref:ABC transporter substrate-binding protein n=1 Tax=Clostridium sp. MB05 TaxID=3376682 RepID=UPI003981A355
MKKVILLVISTVLLIGFLLGFIEVVNKETTENKEVFTYSVSSVPSDFKSVGNLDKRVQDIVCATSRGLVELNASKDIVPSLSEGVKVSEDGLEYDFKIKSDTYWSDGTQITPKDIVAFFREILTEENEKNIGALLNVYGAKNFRDGEGSFTENVGIRAGEDNVVFRLNSKDDKFIKELTEPQYRLRKNVLLWENIKQNYDKLIYSGCYEISEMTITELTLKRNSNINPKLVETIKIVDDEGEELAMAAFEVGGRDIVINPPKSQLSRLSRENRLITLESNKAMYLTFNPNSDIIPLEGKKDIYRLLNRSMEQYQLENSMFIELAEGSYFREDKEDLLKLQARKVMSNEIVQWDKPEEVVLVAEESTQNKEICEYIVEWFKNNTDIYLSYKLITKEEVASIKDVNYYNIALIQGDSSVSSNNSIYSVLINFLPEKHRSQLLLAKTEGEKLNTFSKLEDELFNTYQMLPLVFYNDNIAVNSRIKNMILDGNGNIDYNKIEKS